MVQQITSNLYIDAQREAVFTFQASGQEDIGKVQKFSGVDGKIKFWGSSNTLPNYREQLLMENNLIGAIISAKADILLGQGLYAYREVYRDGEKIKEPVPMPNDWADTFEALDIDDTYLESAALNFYKHGQIFPEFVLNGKRMVAGIQNNECKYIRAQEKVKGKIVRYAHLTDWKDRIHSEDNPLTYIDAYNPDRVQYKYMMHLGDKVFHDGYYYHPSYWGGKHWIETGNSIPIFHKHNIDNGYTIRFHITYPHDYFLNKDEFKLAGNDEDKIKECRTAEEQAKSNFIEKINQFLAGKKNAGRAIYTPDFFDPITKETYGVKITPIKVDMKDEALIKLYDASNKANISAQALHPTLANIESQGKLSSGSEIRNAFLFYLLTKTYRARRILLKPIEHIRKVNNLSNPDLKIGFEDINISKLSDDKSGTQPMNQPTNNEGE